MPSFRQHRSAYGSQYRNTQRFERPLVEANWESFKVAQPVISQWIEAKANSFDFAASLKVAVLRYADLTPGQYDGVERCMQRDQERARQALAAPQAPAADLGRIRAAFDTAVSNGALRASLRYGTLVLSLAPAGGRNPGAIYVKAEGAYAGKIVGATFQPVRECPEGVAALLTEFNVDPAAAAVRYGTQTGTCCCCGAELTDPVSIARSIGPICAGKWGF